MVAQLDKHIAISYLQAVGLYWMGVAAERSGDMSAGAALKRSVLTFSALCPATCLPILSFPLSA